MFKLNPNPTFKVEVSIPTPNGEGKITFEFKHKGRKALKAYIDSLGEGEAAREDADALGELIAGWSGVDEKYSPEALDTLLDAYPGASRSIFESYNRSLLEGRSKN